MNQLFSEWVDAIVERLLFQPTCLDEAEDRAEIPQAIVETLDSLIEQVNSVSSTTKIDTTPLTNFLTENPSITYKLIGTSVIEEGYFDANN